MTQTALPEGWQRAPSGTKHVVSVSIGSSGRDAREELSVLGQHFVLERIGTDGDIAKAAQLIAELDGRVDAFGVGGADIAVVAAGRKYPFREIQQMVRQRLSTHAYPREIDFIAALPKTPSGKIQRFVLRGVNPPER